MKHSVFVDEYIQDRSGFCSLLCFFSEQLNQSLSVNLTNKEVLILQYLLHPRSGFMSKIQ